MIYLEEVLSRVFADSTTKAVKANNNIIVSCDKDYYLPLYICDKKNVKLPSFDVMFNDTYTFFKDLSINYVAQTDDGSVYMVLSFKCYNDGTVLYEDFYEMFPTDTIISIEDYKTHENEFLYFNYDFEFTYNKKVRVS
jgi:hypothetical protein